MGIFIEPPNAALLRILLSDGVFAFKVYGMKLGASTGV
jgi:hypothetical protein